MKQIMEIHRMAEDEIKKAKRKAIQILTRMDRSEYDLSNSTSQKHFLRRLS